MPRRHQHWAALAAAAAILSLSACASGSDAGHSDGGHGEPAPPAAEGARDIQVEASSFRFDPSTLEVGAGETVNIALTSTDVLHDFNVDEAGFHLAAEKGETAEGALTVAEPGTYTVYCSVAGHRESGMEAELVVE
jgi:plastocyanin